MPRADRLKAADGKFNIVGQRVKERRKALKLTQDQLQGRLSLVTEGRWAVSGQEVLNIERGLRTVLDVELMALAKALDCSPLWLLSGDSGDTPDTDRTMPAA
jgi:transcriptional regulator with XRE-family HTH domain